MWFELGGDSRLGQCASNECGGAPTWRLEADGVGANYCSGCKDRSINGAGAMSDDNKLRWCSCKASARGFDQHMAWCPAVAHAMSDVYLETETPTMVRQADIFSVWGVPSDTILKGMTAHQIKLLKSYVEGTTEHAYRIGYDNGVVEGRLDAIEECARICENGEWVGYANQHSPTKSCALAIRDLALNKAEG